MPSISEAELRKWMAENPSLQSDDLPDTFYNRGMPQITPRDSNNEYVVVTHQFKMPRPTHTIEKVIILDGYAKGKRQFRTNKHGGGGFNKGGYKEYLQMICDLVGPVPMARYYGLEVEVHRAMPKSLSVKKRNLLVNTLCTTMPDADNAGGAVMDAVDWAGQDDALVAWFTCYKIWSQGNALVIRIHLFE